MQRQYYDEQHNETYYPEPVFLREEDCRCDMCAYWDISLEFPVSAKVGGKRVRMGQCLGAENHTHGPYAEVQGPNEAAVFTSEDNRCPAFTLSTDAEQEERDNMAERRARVAA